MQICDLLYIFVSFDEKFSESRETNPNIINNIEFGDEKINFLK